MTDTVTPGYSQRIATGEIISKPMSKASEVYDGSDTGFHLRAAYSTYTQDYTETRCSPFYWKLATHVPSGINVDNAIAYAQTKCLAGIKTSNLMGIVALAESNKTLRMVLAPLQTIGPALAYIRQLRKGNVNVTIARSQGRKLLINGRDFGTPKYWHKGPGRLIKPPTGNFVIPAGDTVSSSVLAYNLGVKPLMMDLEAFLKDIPNAHKEERQTYRGGANATSKQSTQNVFGTDYFSVSGTTKTETEVKIRCTALVSDRFDVLSDFGMSVHDIPEAAYELIPGSFVLDYFVNIGNVLGAARALRQENILSFVTVVTTTNKTTREYSGMALKPNQPFNQIVRPLTGSETLTSITKTRTVGTPNPTFAYNPSPIRPVVVQNILSLFVQELKHHTTGARRTFY
jgi:hypothetical protein